MRGAHALAGAVRAHGHWRVRFAHGHWWVRFARAAVAGAVRGRATVDVRTAEWGHSRARFVAAAHGTYEDREVAGFAHRRSAARTRASSDSVVSAIAASTALRDSRRVNPSVVRARTASATSFGSSTSPTWGTSKLRLSTFAGGPVATSFGSLSSPTWGTSKLRVTTLAGAPVATGFGSLQSPTWGPSKLRVTT